MSSHVVPLSLRDAPALIERLFPVQKLSAESYKEQMANVGKTLTALGSYWKGRKPLILNKACILGCLLPATGDDAKDLATFELLMGMDDESFVARNKTKIKPKDILAKQAIPLIGEFFRVTPPDVLPSASPIDFSSDPRFAAVKVEWREDVALADRRRIEAKMLPLTPYRERVEDSYRPEEVMDTVHGHIWEQVNAHLATTASSFPELVEQLGIMRYGKRPVIADTFCGSGQIPFEAARLGCDVEASDLNPVACMLTWGAINIIGAPKSEREDLELRQAKLMSVVQAQADKLDVELDGKGWRGRAYLYCLETRCPSTKWMVPILPSRVVSVDDSAIVELVPNPAKKRYDLLIKTGVSPAKLKAATEGTLRDGQVVHEVAGVEYKHRIATIRGDYDREDGSSGNKLRQWEKSDFKPRPDDIFQERLYAIQWMRPKTKGKGFDFEFRSVTAEDDVRERAVEQFVGRHLAEWQEKGWVPSTRIEPGDKTDEPIRTRGWTYWHQLFTPRQLLLNGLLNGHSPAILKPAVANAVQHNAKLSMWDSSGGGRAGVKNVFSNQALNTLYNFGARGSQYVAQVVCKDYKSFPLSTTSVIKSLPADQFHGPAHVFVTDPPYGDAVKYEEILDFFIAWLRTNPPAEFAGWTWDSRRAIAIKGEDEGFRRGMVAAYKRMGEKMPDNGIQVVMFTHQSGTIWADMANIVWASGLHVTAAWIVATESDSPLRVGANVKGTVLLVLRKRTGSLKTSRDELGYEIQEEVEKQISDLTGLNQAAKGLYRDANVFEDADVQIAGYAAALRVLTRYAIIDGKDMAAEALRPRVNGETTFVDKLITFAVDTANQCLVPEGLDKSVWDALSGPERFYIKLIELEAKGITSLDNYQNFAKAFKVADSQPLMASTKANKGRLRSAQEFKSFEMGEGSQLYQSPLRCMLYAIKELMDETDGDIVIKHLALNVPSYYDQATRDVILAVADFLAVKLENIRPDEASSARVLRDLVRNQRIG